MNRTGPMVMGLILFSGVATASSHMDAPLVTLDPAVNTTDVYAFVSTIDGVKYLTTALAVYPFEEPGIGPNRYNFDDDVLYEIHVALDNDVSAGRATMSYQFRFHTDFRNVNTILQSYLGVIRSVGDEAQNLTQRYTVTRVNHAARTRVNLGGGVVPPNNQGNATPLYNQGDSGENPAKDGVATASVLDPYTAQSIFTLGDGSRVFAGQRDDGFYADIQAVFDLLRLRNPGKDSQGGFNVHTIVLQTPLCELGGDMQIAGVYATTSRRALRILTPRHAPRQEGPFVQVGRQGNPLFCEGFIALADKDLYNRTPPAEDDMRFRPYAENPELARLINALLFPNSPIPGIETGRTDIAGIFIPDLIKVDLSTAAARRAGGGADHPNNPDDSGFSRLSIFGGDTLVSQVQPGFDGMGLIPGGWPNGRRFGDDVVDIGVTALISDLRVSPPIIRGPAGDNVDHNDIAYNKVMPYAATPHNGRIHGHHGASP